MQFRKGNFFCANHAIAQITPASSSARYSSSDFFRNSVRIFRLSSPKVGEGFQVLIVLPKGTNTEKPSFTPKNREDTLLTARNKWLLAHPDSDEAKGGADVGLKGVNLDIAGDIG